jgi:CheY-like chemotaxis protein
MFDFLGLKKKSDKKIKVLVVDDEEAIVQTVQDRLEMKGYTVVTACNGKECLEKAIQHKPDVILLDVVMPVMNGLETLEALRKQPEVKDSIVIMVTARSQSQDIARAKNSGIAGYIVKPFDLNTLLEKIESVVEDRKALAK